MTDIDPVFRTAFLEWRSNRVAWKALVAAVKAEAPRAELHAKAILAGADNEEMLDLIQQRVAAQAHAEDAARLPAARKAAAESRERLTRAEARLQEPGLSVREQDEARDEFQAARVVYTATENAVPTLEMSERFVSGAQAAGVI
jgi:hypothetical protein